MSHRLQTWRFYLSVSAVVVTAAVGYSFAAAPAGQQQDIPRLAAAGRFDDILALLKSQDTHNDKQVTGLVSDIERLNAHKATQSKIHKDALDKAIDAMVEQQKAGTLDKALLSAVDAHNLSATPAATLADPRIVALVKQAETEARKKEADGDWLEAGNLFRLLNALYEESAVYRDELRDSDHHLRLLRLYVPDELKKMLDERARRNGKESADSPNFGSETWQDMLQGVSMSIYKAALTHAAANHVSMASTNYAKVMLGALDGLKVVGETPALGNQFPGMKDAAAAKRFSDGLTSIRKSVADARNYDYLAAVGVNGTLDQLLDLNRRSINLPEQVLAFEMADGGTNVLDDFTAIIWPREVSEFARNTQGKFFGVGIQISLKYDAATKLQRLAVVSPLPDTPAQKAGIRPGDFIVTVDGAKTTGWTLDQAVHNITGPEGTDVLLGVERAGEARPLNFKLKRAEVLIESIKGFSRNPQGGWNYFVDEDTRIGYVRMTNFIPQTATDLDAAVAQMQAQGGLNALILDLRFNPGGLLNSAEEICDRFIKSGTVVSTVGKTGEMTSEYKAKSNRNYADFPVVVLVNEGSASASEIVSGALQDHKRATIIGSRSFGKGSVQDLYPLEGGKAYLKLTTQYYRLPFGRIIHRKPGASVWGIEPDINVKMTAEEVQAQMIFRQDLDVLRDKSVPATQPAPIASDLLEKGLDPQLESAMVFLKSKLIAPKMTVANVPATAPPAP